VKKGGIPMNSRIRELRRELKLSGEKFGKRIGITKTAVSKIELNHTGITESTIKLLCSEFSVNEAWLRTGEGPMFITDINDRFAALAGRVMASGDEFQKELLAIIMELNEGQIRELKNIVRKLAKLDPDAEPGARE
jgi:transcriptional regulator with XRE-family HTH domain